MKVTTREDEPDRIRIRNHRRVFDEYEHHCESKSAMPDGTPCRATYAGVLFRRTIRVGSIIRIGKETNHLDKQQNQSVTNLADVFTVYPKNDRNTIRHSFGGKSSRAIAMLVNEYCAGIRQKIADENLLKLTAKDRRTRERAERRLIEIGESSYYFRHLGRPVKINYKMVQRYFNGGSIRDTDQERAIVITAAKQIAHAVGIDAKNIDHVGGSPRIKPEMVLAIWRESGMPANSAGTVK